jgi:hypothetical protein
MGETSEDILEIREDERKPNSSHREHEIMPTYGKSQFMKNQMELIAISVALNANLQGIDCNVILILLAT